MTEEAFHLTQVLGNRVTEVFWDRGTEAFGVFAQPFSGRFFTVACMHTQRCFQSFRGRVLGLQQ